MINLNVSENERLLISQYDQSPRFKQLAQGLLDVIQAELVKPVLDLQKQSNLDTATGIWLDYIGTRLDLQRPQVAFRPDGDRFKYSEGTKPKAEREGTGFDQAPFDSTIPACLLYTSPSPRDS